jgi:hypothetical protein
MYFVKSWDTNQILSEHKTLAIARRYCRGQGHTGEEHGGRYDPIAFVTDEDGYCVYNPHFWTRLSSSLAGFVQAYDDCLRG